MNLRNQWFFGFATSIQERIDLLPSTTNTDNPLDALEHWRLRKTLVDDLNFQTMLRCLKITKKEFNTGVAPLTEASLKILFDYVQQQPWYKLHKKLFVKEQTFFSSSLDAALRFHVKYYSEYIDNYMEHQKIKLSKDCSISLKEQLVSDLMSIAKRTLVWDLHDVKTRMLLEAADSTAEFDLYIQTRFHSSMTTEIFFLEYPTLARLLAERLTFALENFKLLIQALMESSSRLEGMFGISQPFQIERWEAGKGDSHSRGKTTTMLTINNIPLVFKYHNNDALISFNKFLACIEKKEPGSSFFKISCISGKNYCFEEHVQNKSCSTSSQIKQYYKNYGHLVALTYWMGSIDLHMENLIAHRYYPVLVDVETLMRPEKGRIYTQEYNKENTLEMNSVISTGLLPMYKYWKRQFDISALNAHKQKLPFQVRKVMNSNTSDMAYQLEDTYLPTAQNLPLLNNTPTPYKDYEPEIIAGYEEMINHLMVHKDEYLKALYELFHHLPLRVLLRDTADYQNLLDFSTHPTCMVDYIEREKIFENLWNNSFIHPEVAIQEVYAMLGHDTPYFYVYTDSLNIHTTEATLENYYSKSILLLAKTYIETITPNTISISLSLIKESLTD